MTRTVLISGAGIAGPSLAFWLGRGGYDVTVVERSSGLRASGAAVDFRGDQMALLRRMDVLADIQARQTGMGDQLVVDATGRRLATFPAALFSGEVEIDRGDLALILHERTKHHVDYVFGDHITAIAEHADGVDVTFANGPARTFDLVVGADGLNSAVRRLTVGPDDPFRHDLGFYAVGFTTANTFGLDHSGLTYNEPNRYISISSARNTSRASVSMVFTAPALDYDRQDTEQQKRVVAQHFAGVGWKTPEVLAALRAATDLYVTPLSQIRLDRWSTGRVTLLGDAAWCAGPGGNGTGHAMLGAYTLAGELAAANGDHGPAFARYEQIMRPTVEKSQKFAAKAGGFLAPPTQRKINRRNRTYRILSSSLLTSVFTRLSKKNTSTGKLTDYPLPSTSRVSGSPRP
ncbi:FAD-dependent monooxygenase [Actinocrispum wychmicini]|uniref:2-polyprenyl-6-methoxyphenol hydroxylase-like FAD-dependent oxidoreductase n=1 Tax=Actinocrispum wychmicini TaxID=1213861 RepID=A0A4R2JD85_9PSEU|nr:FAD-dependent monooxygenase [Actinocrispum wychmicini]TCO54129.1 2-polyprenyl-6-methoxyphenol hydroxylase-like FAD-dependent oxidoreductase [Actinocrispum wychmicini]